MTWRIEFAADAERDFALVFDHLIDSYLSLGESRGEASRHAEQRLGAILDASLRIGITPHRGQRYDDLSPGLRQLALGKATFWFAVDEAKGIIRVLAVFFGSQDQQRRMLIRLLERCHDS